MITIILPSHLLSGSRGAFASFDRIFNIICFKSFDYDLCVFLLSVLSSVFVFFLSTPSYIGDFIFNIFFESIIYLTSEKQSPARKLVALKTTPRQLLSDNPAQSRELSGPGCTKPQEPVRQTYTSHSN